VLKLVRLEAMAAGMDDPATLFTLSSFYNGMFK